MSQSARTVERARGRWREVLMHFGIDEKYLHNRHGPCPLCGGKDRFRFDDRHGSGSYFCNQCGAGGAIIMLRKLHDWDHSTACGEVDKIIGTASPLSPAATSPTPASATRLAKIERVIADATDASVVECYLRGRDLGTVPAVLLGHRSLAYCDDDGPVRWPLPGNGGAHCWP